MNTPVDPQARLELIAEVIQSARRHFQEEQANFLLIWGYGIGGTSLVHYFLLQFAASREYAYAAWLLIIPVAVFALYYRRRLGRQSVVKTYPERMVQQVWLTMSAGMVLVGIHGPILGTMALPVLLLLYGAGLYLTGAAFRLLPVRIGGIICGVCSLLAFRMEMEAQLLILSAALMAGFVIPGHWTRKAGRHV